ncbi:UNVERIFIED_CONTAM: hypothetical protein NCL1_08611 [Trichonephila clavipes]
MKSGSAVRGRDITQHSISGNANDRSTFSSISCRSSGSDVADSQEKHFFILNENIFYVILFVKVLFRRREAKFLKRISVFDFREQGYTTRFCCRR